MFECAGIEQILISLKRLAPYFILLLVIIVVRRMNFLKRQ